MLNKNNLVESGKKINLNIKRLDLKIRKLKSLKTLFLKKIFIFNINITLNNIYITITNNSGKVIFLGSGGSLKLKNMKRNTTYVMQLLLISLLRQMQKKRIRFVVLRINNVTKKYRKLIFKYFFQYNIKLICIQNSFSTVYNGVRLKKQRRI